MITTFRAPNFFEAWVTVCDQRRDALLAWWFNSPAFTSLVLCQHGCIIEEVANRLNLRSYSGQRGYYDIDAILFDNNLDLVPKIPPETIWVRRIRIAFEHENNFVSGLFQEVSHLLITDCDLRVVVTYPRKGDDLQAELRELHQIIAETDRAAHIVESEGFLFISGWRDGDAPTIEWSGFVYDRTDWRQI